MTMTKTLTFACVHFTVAFTVAWVISGNLLVGGAIALVEPAINTVAYFFHELAWRRVQAPPARSLAQC
jgi:uncharacterized membrane protein